MRASKTLGIQFFTTFLTLCVLFGIRVYLLSDVGLFDYDSVKNYQVIQEVAKGNMTNLFHHISPLFFLFYSFIYSVSDDFLFLEYVNAAFNLGAIFYFICFVRKQFQLSFSSFILLLFFCGTSCFLVVSSRYFSIESSSLFLFFFLIIYYFKSIQSKLNHTKREQYLYLTVFFFALLLGINYKIILLIPMLIIVEIVQKSRKLTTQNYSLISAIIGGAILFYSLLGFWYNNDFLLYAKYFYVVAFVKDVNPNAVVSSFNWDVFFYFKYILEFETSLFFIAIITIIFNYKSISKIVKQLLENGFKSFFFQSERNKFLLFITFLFLCYFFGMSVLQKAPRGLLFAYPLLYILVFVGFQKAFQRTTETTIFTFLKTGVLIFGIGYNIFLLQKNIYNYCESNYDKVGIYLQKNNIKKLATTVGIGVYPFAENVEISPVFSISDLEKLKQKGYKHCLIDSYYLASHTLEFEKLKTEKSLLKLKEQTLLSPFLFLEHCEYAGISYSEAKNTWQKARKSNYQLYLVKL